MNEESNSRLSRTSEIASLETIATTNTSQGLVINDGTSTPSTCRKFHRMRKIQVKKLFKSYILSSQENINLQYSSSDAYRDSNNDDREPIFVIVDSSNTSNHSSKEILINKRNTIKEGTIKRHLRQNVIPVDTPCTSTEQTNFILTQEQQGDSREELQMVDINLQSENEIEIDNVDNEKEPESIVVAYLRNKDAITDDNGLTITRKKSSLLENVPKMETIPENKQFTLFSGQLTDSSSESRASTDAKNENDRD